MAENPVSPETFEEIMQALDVLMPLAVAVSGGGDSVALMHLVAGWAKARGCLGDIYVLSVDHGLRAGASAEIAQVIEQCQSMGLAHQTLIWQGEKPASNIQAEARDARYGLLTDWCVANGIKDLAVGHTRDDQVETFLMRLARGSGVTGLSAMSQTRPLRNAQGTVRLVRPLLNVTRDSLRATLKDAGQSWAEDPSNDDLKFMRVKARQMRAHLSDLDLTDERIVSTVSRLQRVREALDVATEELFSQCAWFHGAGFASFDLALLRGAPAEIGLRILSQLLIGIGGKEYGPRLARLERLYDQLMHDDRTVATLHGCRVVPAGAAYVGKAQVKGTHMVVRELRNPEASRIEIGTGEPVFMHWDNRFDIEVTLPKDATGGGTPDSWSLRFCLETGARMVRTDARMDVAALEGQVPRIIWPGLPALFRGNHMVCVPNLGWYSPESAPESGLETNISVCFRRLTRSTDNHEGEN